MLLIRQAEIVTDSRRTEQYVPLDIRCRNGLIVEIGPSLVPVSGEVVLEGNGGALLPGIHDHHIHLFALAASRQSIACGPPAINTIESLARVLADADGNGWIRGTGYHESVAGMLHREQLDEWVQDRPLRIQHRSGKMWFVNSMAARQLNLDQHHRLEGVECDSNGAPTGRLFRMDEWIGKQLRNESIPDIKAISKELASYGVTGVTDATPGNSSDTLELYSELIAKGELLQRVRLMGDKSLPAVKKVATGQKNPSIHLPATGSLKIMLDDYALPDFENLKREIMRAHQQARSVAIHCVTAVELVFAVSALREAGALSGDRIEHGSVISDQMIPLLRSTGITVVTQPNFIAEKGDQYMSDVETSEHQDLYRTKSLLDARIPVGGSTDAPFGNPDPWKAMTAAVSRKTSGGRTLGQQEQVTPELALQLFTSPADNPGGRPRSIEVGYSADLCLLNRPWHSARLRLNQEDVIATICAGEIIWASE
jgi:predicted amidohydrolase YtcJ